MHLSFFRIFSWMDSSPFFFFLVEWWTEGAVVGWLQGLVKSGFSTVPRTPPFRVWVSAPLRDTSCLCLGVRIAWGQGVAAVHLLLLPFSSAQSSVSSCTTHANLQVSMTGNERVNIACNILSHIYLICRNREWKSLGTKFRPENWSFLTVKLTWAQHFG